MTENEISYKVRGAVPVDIIYDDHKLRSSLRLDMLVENKIIV